jgi:prepilin-type processing-associated H-X9-DG protein
MAGTRKADIVGAYVAFGVLVVVAIVFSLMSRPKTTGAPNNVCLSKERQLGLALLQYAQDYDHQLPSGVTQKGFGWAGQIYGLMKSSDVFKCPDDPTIASAPNSTVSYGYNLNIARRLGKLKEGDPRAVVMLFEVEGCQAQVDKADEGLSDGAKQFSGAGDGTDGSLSGGAPPTLQYATGILGKRPALSANSQFAGPEGRHRKGANYLMVDGHSHWYLPSKVSSGTDALHAKDYQAGGLNGRAAGTGNGDFIATFSTR